MKLVADAKSSLPLAVVVDDEPLIRMIAVDALTEAGFVVVEASQASEALAVLASRHVDIQVLIADIHLPGGMDGLQLVRRVSEQWPWIGLLLASGKVRPTSLDMPAGCRFLPKPYAPDYLITHVRELVAAG